MIATNCHLRLEEGGFVVLTEVLFDDITSEYIIMPFRRSLVDNNMRFFMSSSRDKIVALESFRSKLSHAAREAKELKDGKRKEDSPKPG